MGERPHSQWGNTVKNAICIMHLLSDVDNVLCDTVLGGKINESLHFHSAKLPTYKNKKLCQKEVEKEKIQYVFLLRIHSLSKKSEQVA